MSVNRSGFLGSVLNFLGSSSSWSWGLGGLGSSGSLGLDIIKSGTDDGSGSLDDSSGPVVIIGKLMICPDSQFVRNLLLSDDTFVLSLLVQSSPGLCPHKLSWLLSVVQQSLGLGSGQGDRL